jgi:hypothetical protein
VVDPDRAGDADPRYLPVAGGTQHGQYAVHAGLEVVEQVGAGTRGAGEVHDAVDRVSPAQFQQRRRVTHVDVFDEHAPSQFGPDEVRLPRRAMPGEHARLTGVQQRPRGVQADEAEPAGHQNHDFSAVHFVLADVTAHC